MKKLSIAAAVFVASSVSAVNAEPVALGTAELDNVTAGCYYCGYDWNFNKSITESVNKRINVDGYIDPVSRPTGHTAISNAVADATGRGSFSEATTQTITSGSPYYYGGGASFSGAHSLSSSQ